MKKGFLIIILGMVLLFAGAVFAAQSTWKVDTAHTNIGFSVTHLGLSKVHGQFKDYEAWIKADDKTGKISWVKAKAKVKSINTEEPKRDEHLQSPDFFNAAKYPEIVLETKSIKWQGDKFSGIAKVTIKGITKDVAFKGRQTGLVHAAFGGEKTLRTGYEVSATLNRQDFGLTFNGVVEGVNIVSDEVTLDFEVQIFRPEK